MGRRTAPWDASLYAASALVALAVTLTTDAPLDRQWALSAIPGYATGAFLAWAVSRRGGGVRARALVAVGVFAAVALVPLLVHAETRIDEGRTPAKSDVLVVEEAADRLLDGENPYGARFGEGLLATWPELTRAHFPYLPATLAFGVPRSVAGPSAWADPRVLCLAVTLALAMPSLALAAAGAAGRLRAFQVLLVLASGAPLVFTSGKELPVLALILASLVAFDRGRPVIGGLAAGLAASVHQLAWVVVPFIAVVAWDRRPEGSSRRAIILIAATTIVVVGPFLVWDTAAFIEDTVLFPLGLHQPSSGASFTPGSILAGSVPGARSWLIAVLGVTMTILVITLARRIRGGSVADVAEAAGVVLLVALLLTPRVRLAYLAFPLNLLVWSRLVLRRGRLRAGSAFEPGLRPAELAAQPREAGPPLLVRGSREPREREHDEAGWGPPPR